MNHKQNWMGRFCHFLWNYLLLMQPSVVNDSILRHAMKHEILMLESVHCSNKDTSCSVLYLNLTISFYCLFLNFCTSLDWGEKKQIRFLRIFLVRFDHFFCSFSVCLLFIISFVQISLPIIIFLKLGNGVK